MRDLYDSLWYPGIVSRVAPARHAVTIHFLGFNSLWFDEVRSFLVGVLLYMRDAEQARLSYIRSL